MARTYNVTGIEVGRSFLYRRFELIEIGVNHGLSNVVGRFTDHGKGSVEIEECSTDACGVGKGWSLSQRRLTRRMDELVEFVKE